MFRFSMRASRALIVLALAASACVDEQDPIDPAQNPAEASDPRFAAGDVYTVTTTNDNGIGSLRWALSYTTGGETIRFDPSLAGQTIALDSSLELKHPITIEGPTGGITISGQGQVRLFLLHHPDTVFMRNLSITGGKVPNSESGGAMLGLGDVVLENSAVYGHQAGGIAAIYAGDLVLINTTVSGNTSTYPYNDAHYPAVLSSASMQVINSTIAFNSDGGIGPGGRLTLRNSALSNNGDGKNCSIGSSPLSLEGKNMADDDTCGGPTGAIIADPLLAPLADNGGPNLTHALKAGSPAINAGTSCSLAVDQRYVARDAQCDLGAFEFIDFTTVTITINTSPIIDPVTKYAVVSGMVQCSRAETFEVHVLLEQDQRMGRTSTNVHAAASTPVSCSTTARPWSVALTTTDGTFMASEATATAGTLNAAPWVSPASVSSPVRLFWGKR